MPHHLPPSSPTFPPPPAARHYHPTLSIWLSVDPMSDKYPGVSPYAYCGNNPVVLKDPDGRDPIYGRANGGIAKIGDDGKNDGKSYFVLGKVAADVRKATLQEAYYSGDLSPSDRVLHIPTGGVLEDVENTVELTHCSGNTVDERVEYGGHANRGDECARIWDKGAPVKIEGTKKTWTITPFKINGKNHQQGTSSANNIIHIWHVQPNDSEPSQADYSALKSWSSRSYAGTTFVIGDNSRTVSFYNDTRTIITIPYETFLKMGRREEL